jgi:biopolymer transport protein ExbB
MDALNNAVDYGIIGLLLALSVWSVAIAVERWLYYRQIDLAQFASLQTLEIALQAARRNRYGGGQRAVHRPPRHGPGHHAHISYHGNIGDHGRQYDHDRIEPPTLKATAVGLLVAIPASS